MTSLEKKRLLWKEENAAKDAYIKAGAKGAILMSRKAYNNIHKDYRTSIGDKSYPSCLCNVPGVGTCLCPVQFT